MDVVRNVDVVRHWIIIIVVRNVDVVVVWNEWFCFFVCSRSCRKDGFEKR